jgi:MFS family permease
LSTLSLALRARTFRSLRRHYNYRLFFAGQVVSLAGSWMQNVALAWLVLSLSRSPLAVASLLFCRFAPYMFLGLFAGSVVDRLDTLRLVIWTQAAAMLVSAGLAFVTLTGTATLPVVYVLAALGGVTLVLDAPGRQTLTFQMVGPSELPNAVALNSGLLNASRVIGPALAGVLIASVGTGICFLINTVSFLAVLAALVLMRESELYPRTRDRTATLLAGTREGLRFAWADPQTRAVLSVVTVVGLVGLNFNTLVPLLASDTLHVNARTFGLLSAAFGLGALGGALATASFRHATWRAFAGGVVGFSLLMLALAPIRSAWPTWVNRCSP